MSLLKIMRINTMPLLESFGPLALIPWLITTFLSLLRVNILMEILHISFTSFHFLLPPVLLSIYSFKYVCEYNMCV